MAEDEDGGFVGTDEDGTDEDFKVVHHVMVPAMLKGEGEKEEGGGLNVKGKFLLGEVEGS